MLGPTPALSNACNIILVAATFFAAAATAIIMVVAAATIAAAAAAAAAAELSISYETQSFLESGRIMINCLHNIIVCTFASLQPKIKYLIIIN